MPVSPFFVRLSRGKRGVRVIGNRDGRSQSHYRYEWPERPRTSDEREQREELKHRDDLPRHPRLELNPVQARRDTGNHEAERRRNVAREEQERGDERQLPV